MSVYLCLVWLCCWDVVRLCVDVSAFGATIVGVFVGLSAPNDVDLVCVVAYPYRCGGAVECAFVASHVVDFVV